jgi:SAM-dependent methyltransferase
MPVDTRILSREIETSVTERGLSPQSIWMDKQDSLEKGARRCDAMFRAVDGRNSFTVLDVGCGPGYAIPFLEGKFGAAFSGYLGVDVSEMLISAARARWPRYEFAVRDIVADPLPELSYDHVVLNGVITAKFNLPYTEMEQFAMTLLSAAWQSAKVCLSFNVMNTHVDWQRDDLFHWPMDSAAAFCVKHLCRNINVLADYGLYEYTVQVFRSPSRPSAIPVGWAEQG